MQTLIEILNRFGATLTEFAWSMFVQSSLLILVLFLLDQLLRRWTRAVVRYALWLVVLIKLLLPPSLALPSGIGYWIGRDQPGPAAVVEVAAVMTPALESADPGAVPTATEPARLALNRSGSLALVWIAGSLILLGVVARRRRLVARWIATATDAPAGWQPLLEECLQRLGVRRRVRVKLAPETNLTSTGPALCGLFRPVVLLPARLSDALSLPQIRSVLLHEAVHLRRHDLWVSHAQMLLQVLYWWHPLLWLANARLRRVREEAVDEAVVVALEREAEVYAPTLLAVAKLAFHRPGLTLGLVGVLESKAALKQRIRRLVTGPAPRSAKMGFAGAMMTTALAALLLPMAQGARTVAAMSPDEPPVSKPSAPVPAAAGFAQRLDGALPTLEAAPRMASLERSAPGTATTTAQARDGRLVARGTTLRWLIPMACGVKPNEVVFRTPVSEDKYDAVLNLPSGNREAFRRLLREQCGLTATPEMRLSTVTAFQVKTKDAPGLRPAAPNEDRSNLPFGFHFDFYRHPNGTVAQLIDSAALVSGRRLVDETGLTNRYSIDVRWDNPGVRQFDLARFQEALERELGIRAKMVQRAEQVLIVESAGSLPAESPSRLQPPRRSAGGSAPGTKAPERAAAAAAGPQIRFDESIHDFGRVPASGAQKHTFIFTNTGTQTLEITQVRPSCGCTTATNFDRRVEPGRTGRLSVELNTGGLSGDVQKSITVSCNDPIQRVAVLFLKATIWRPIDVQPPYVMFAPGTNAGSSEVRVARIVNNTDQPLKVSPPQCNSTNFQVELKPVVPGKEFELRIQTVPPLKPGTTTGFITVNTSSTNTPVILLNAYAILPAATNVAALKP